MPYGGLVAALAREQVEVVPRIVPHLGAAGERRRGRGVRRSAAVEVRDLHQPRARHRRGVLGRPPATELGDHVGGDLVAPGGTGDRGQVLQGPGEGERTDLTGPGHHRDHPVLPAERAADLRPDPQRGGPQQLPGSVVLGREPGRGEAVHHRDDRDHRGEVGPAGRGGDHVAAAQRVPPQHDAAGVDPGQGRRARDRGPQVVDLTAQRDDLPRLPGALAEAAVVEGQHVQADRREGVGERGEAAVLGAGEPVRHHHDRTTARAGERVARRTVVVGGADRAAGGEGGGGGGRGDGHGVLPGSLAAFGAAAP